ncbi:Hypothetical protein PFR_JS13-2_252 [Propionibacterium freudenreichii]|nr:Hypothetical protein PFR_JS11_252 [Propionibacterium freudenreichii]SCQ47422.1 Hypothetical protein PFR_JS13-1_252 [Propionibacterium freudenreichii]SCQ51028.1 Hypothetical protein PFR_JS13-2_252 [Propionibacterium freudenreichii]
MALIRSLSERLVRTARRAHVLWSRWSCAGGGDCPASIVPAATHSFWPRTGRSGAPAWSCALSARCFPVVVPVWLAHVVAPCGPRRAGCWTVETTWSRRVRAACGCGVRGPTVAAPKTCGKGGFPQALWTACGPLWTTRLSACGRRDTARKTRGRVPGAQPRGGTSTRGKRGTDVSGGAGSIRVRVGDRSTTGKEGIAVWGLSDGTYAQRMWISRFCADPGSVGRTDGRDWWGRVPGPRPRSRSAPARVGGAWQ